MNMKKNTNKDFILSRFLFDILTDVFVVVILVLLIRAFFVAPFQIHGPSMCDTFNVYDEECISGNGEYSLVSRLSTWDIFGWSPTDLQRGDVVIFQAPYGEDGEYYIKRVIGLPGETVKIKGGLVYVSDESGEMLELDESEYLNEDNLGNTNPYQTAAETYEIPEGEYFVLGDNRTRSSDARRCFQQVGCDDKSSPFLDIDLIEGEVRAVIFPLSHFRFIGGVEYWF